MFKAKERAGIEDYSGEIEQFERRGVEPQGYEIGTSGEGLARVYFLTQSTISLLGHYGIKPKNLGEEDIRVLEKRGRIFVLDIEVSDEENDMRYNAAIICRKGEERGVVDILHVEDNEGYIEQKILQRRGLSILNPVQVQEIPISALEENIKIPLGTLLTAVPNNAFYSLHRDNQGYVGEAFLGSSHGLEHMVSQMENAREM